MRGSLIHFLQSTLHRKAILYSNTRNTALSLKDMIANLMDANDINGDSIVIHGELESHTKFYRAKQFTRAHKDGRGEASDLVEISDVEISDEVVKLYLNNNHHLGSPIWTEMIRTRYRFNLEGWSLSRVAMVVFGSGSTVGATFDLHFFAQEQANFCVKK
eukprot:scaffold214470_cov48-Attheya_sp.AAC.1